MSNRDQAPTIALARDEFTATRRDLDNHPEAVKSSSRIDVVDPYGNVATWVVDLYRLEGRVTAFVQRGATDDYIRLVIPPEVTSAIARHQSALITKHRRKVARRSVADLRAQSGEQVETAKERAAARRLNRRRELDATHAAERPRTR